MVRKRGKILRITSTTERSLPGTLRQDFAVQRTRLDDAYVARRVLELQIIMLEIVLQRFFDDLVVTMILAPILKRPFPRAAILQLG